MENIIGQEKIGKDPIYLITSMTHKKQKIFANPEIAKFLLQCVAYHKFIMNFRLYAYVILPDHMHLLIQPTSSKFNTSKIMQFIKGIFSKKYNELKHTNPHFMASILNENNELIVPKEFIITKKTKQYIQVWKESFKEVIIENEKSFRETLEMIHYNPVREALVSKPEDYEFSSFNQYFLTERRTMQAPIDKFEVEKEYAEISSF